LKIYADTEPEFEQNNSHQFQPSFSGNMHYGFIQNVKNGISFILTKCPPKD